MNGASGAHLSDYEIRMEGWKVLTEHLGVSGAIRFLTQYVPGFGDYTQERRELFTVDGPGGGTRHRPAAGRA